MLKQPVHGQLLQSTANGAVDVEQFSFDDIRFMSEIAYLHSDTETTNDSLKLEVSDGQHTAVKEVSMSLKANLTVFRSVLISHCELEN